MQKVNAKPFSSESGTADHYQLEDLFVDMLTRQVKRDGVDLNVTRLSFDLLVALIRAEMALVTYQQLMDEVWQGSVISPETLTQRIKLLRQSLGDSADNPRYILAVRGVGYRLQVPPIPGTQTNRLTTPESQPGLETRSFSPKWKILVLATVVMFLAVAARWVVLESPSIRSMMVSSMDKAEASQYVKQANSVVNGTAPSFVAAESLFAEATRYNPNLSEAWSGRALNRAGPRFVGSPLAKDMDDARLYAEEALRLDPNNIEALMVIASLHAMKTEWFEAEAVFTKALRMNQIKAMGMNSNSFFLPSGQLEKAGIAAKEFYELQPKLGMSSFFLAIVERTLENNSEAQRLANETLEFQGDPESAKSVLAFIAAREGRFEEAGKFATKALPRLIRRAGGDQVVKDAYSALNNPTKQPEALAKLRELMRSPAWEDAYPREREVVWFLFARFGAIDDLYEQFNLMTQFAEDGTTQIIAVSDLWLPELREFRRDERFQELVHRLNLIEYWEQRGAPDGCRLSDSRILCD